MGLKNQQSHIKTLTRSIIAGLLVAGTIIVIAMPATAQYYIKRNKDDHQTEQTTPSQKQKQTIIPRRIVPVKPPKTDNKPSQTTTARVPRNKRQQILPACSEKEMKITQTVFATLDKDQASGHNKNATRQIKKIQNIWEDPTRGKAFTTMISRCLRKQALLKRM